MIRGILVFCTLALLSSAASAQELKYDAIINDEGEIELLPTDRQLDERPPRDREDAQGAGADFLTRGADTSMEEFTGFVERVKRGEVETFLQVGQDGEVQGLFQFDPKSTASGALLEAAKPGTRIEKVGWTAESWLPTDDEINKLANELAKRLMEAMRNAACDMDPRPTSITPTVEMSVSFIVGTSMSVSALWETERVCS